MSVAINYQWEDCTMGFNCPECGAELCGDSQDGEEKCVCGLKYQLCSYLLINGEKASEYKKGKQ